MKLKKLIITSKAIKITSEVVLGKIEGTDQTNTRVGTDSFHEEPLAEFTAAISELTPIALTACEIPDTWKEGVSVTGFQVKHTKQGSRSVILHVEKLLENFATPWKFKTPQVHIDPAQDGEDYEMEIKPNLAAKVAEAIHRAEKYRDGERSQQLLFEQGAETGGEDELPM